jgi:two-component system, NarL family, response regulator
MNTTNRALRILVVDDHPMVRHGLVALIDHQPDLTVAAEASNGREAVAQFQALAPDVVLMDLRLPELDGVEAIEQIRALNPRARIIVLTTYDADEDIYRGLRAGAMGYLLKDASAAELLEAIRAVAAGQKRIPLEVAAKLAERMNSPELTARELEVLRLLARGQSNKEIGVALAIAEGTVRTHLNSIFQKIDAQDRTQAVTIAIRRGLVRLL